jgi:hypothetical protein
MGSATAAYVTAVIVGATLLPWACRRVARVDIGAGRAAIAALIGEGILTWTGNTLVAGRESLQLGLILMGGKVLLAAALYAVMLRIAYIKALAVEVIVYGAFMAIAIGIVGLLFVTNFR